MTKEELMRVFNECFRTKQGIRIEVTMPNQEEPEIIINTNKSLEIKRRFYDRNYNDELINIKNDKMRIIDARPIQIKRRQKEIVLFKEV